MTDASGTVIRYAAGGAAGRRRFDDQEAAGDGAFDARMAAYLGGDAGAAVSAQSLLSIKLVVTQLQYDRGLTDVSAPIPAEKTFIVSVHLTDIPSHELSCAARWCTQGTILKGASASSILKTVLASSLPPHFIASIFTLGARLWTCSSRSKECQEACQSAFSVRMAA